MSKKEQIEFINNVLATQDTYRAKSKAYLSAIQQGNKEAIAFIITLAGAILPKKKNYDAMIFLNTLRIIKEGMDQNNDEFLQKVQSNLLSVYVDLGKFKSNDPDDTRGRFFFSDKPDKNLEIIGNSCLRLILECILMWPQLFPSDAKGKDTKFKTAYDALVKAKVAFPKEVNYFKKKTDKKNNQGQANAAGQGSGLQSSGFQKPAGGQLPIDRVKQIQEKLEESRNYKDLLLNILSVSNESELEQENLLVIGDYFSRSLKQYEADLNYLLNDGTQEKLLAQLFMEQEFAQDLLQDMQNYQTKAMKFKDFKAKYVTIIAKENQTPTPNQQEPGNHNNDEEAAHKEKGILDSHNQAVREKELSQPNIHSALRNEEQKKVEDDDSPVLENNENNHEGFNNKAQHLNDTREKKSAFFKEEDNLRKSEENHRIINKEEEEDVAYKPSQHENIKKGQFNSNEDLDVDNKPPYNNRKNSRRSSQASNKNLMRQSDPKLQQNDAYESKSNNYRSEYLNKNQAANVNPYGFRSVMVKKESPMRPAVQKLFEIDENYRIDSKAPNIRSVMPRNEEKLSQIMNAKDFDRFSENSEKPRSEIFDNVGESKKENVTLKDENQELKAKLANLMSSYQETEEVLERLKKENQLLQEKHAGMQDEGFINELANQENLIEKLKQHNENLRAENLALSDHIRQQQLENERIKNEMMNKGGDMGKAEDFEALEVLRKENEALRNYLNENKLKDNEGEKELLNKLMQENQELRAHMQEAPKLKANEGDFRNSALSHENFEFEEPRIKENLPVGNSVKTKFINNTRNNNANTKHWVQSSNNNDPDERGDERKEREVSPHKKMIFEKQMQVDTEDLKKSIDVGSEKKKRSNEASHNQSMDESNHPRLSNYLKRSGKVSRNESQKSAHTDPNRSFDEGPILGGFAPQQQPQPRLVIKSSMPYEGPRNFEENFDTNSVMNASLISVSQANQRFEESPYQSDLIYPFQKPADYYQGKKSGKQVKGFLIQNERGGIFDEIDKLLRENSFRFKISCLRPKSLLYDNNTVQLGLISGIYQHNEKNLLKITLYFGNLTKYEINDFKVMYSGSSAISLWTKPDILATEINPKSQAKQDLLIDINSIPYPFIMARASFNYQGNSIKFSVPIPMTINKFLQSKLSDASSFKYKWKAESGNLFKSEIIDLNPRIAKSVYDFKKYFPNLIDLTPHKEYDYVSGVEDYKLCGIFEVGQGYLEVLLKIVAQPNKKALFQVATKNTEVAEFLIRTLVFIFRKEGTN